MDTTYRLLFFIFMVMMPSECSETAKPQCKEMNLETFLLPEGEALYVVPFAVRNSSLSDEFVWHKNGSQISNDENETVHYHGRALFILNASTENSGVYTLRHRKPSGKCFYSHVQIDVFKSKMDEALFFGPIKNSDQNKKVPCPDHLVDTCEMFDGKFTWEKDFKLLPGIHENRHRVNNATANDEGIYTCTCTWTHGDKVYNSSGSSRLILEDVIDHQDPVIISPAHKELFADEGSLIKLNCSVFCGINVAADCDASWNADGIDLNQENGYHQTTTIEETSKKYTISTAVLTIDKVSAKDFQIEFECVGKGLFLEESATLTLKRRESMIPLVTGGVCVLFFCVFVAMLVKYFAIDLALFLRPYLPLRGHNKDAGIYDAYVVYQMQSKDKVTEDTLCQFVTKYLPSVLEEKCGYRLFIHGRDDIPGEDRLELVEDRMKQSRRLMVILTPGTRSRPEMTDRCPASPQNSVIGGFDWQVGLHHALVQREMSVILIQLGDTGPEGYTHLPPGLQHLIRKSAPIRWPESSWGATAALNSRFWKRVRYLMPATPARKCPQSLMI